MTRPVSSFIDPTKVVAEESHIAIIEAYAELSTRSFAAWMRLMVATDNDLAGGRKALAKIINRSEGRLSVILRELIAKGYVSWRASGKAWVPGTLRILRRASISGPNRFVRFSHSVFDTSTRDLGYASVLSDAGRRAPKRPSNDVDSSFFRERAIGGSDNDTTQQDGASEDVANERGANSKQSFDPELAKVFRGGSTARSIGLSKNLSGKGNNKGVRLKSRNQENPSDESEKLPPKSTTKDAQTRSGIPKTSSKCTLPRATQEQKMATKTTSTTVVGKSSSSKAKGTEAKSSQENAQKSSRISALSLRVKENSEKRKVEALKKAKLQQAAKAERRKEQLEKLKSTPTQDAFGVTFMPSVQLRQEYIRTLKRSLKDKERQKLLNRLGRIFREIYTKYAALKDTSYTMHVTEFSRCTKAAELCIYKGVTPSQVIRYWDNNIDNFHTAGSAPAMRYPSLSFISSPHAIEAVAVANVDSKGNFIKKKPKPAKKAEPERHGWGTSKALRKGYRDALEAAGFETSQLTDVHLTDLQKGAIHNAKGGVLHVGSSVRPIFNWTITNLAPSWIAADKAAAGEDDE